jgi:hypothetical protein
MTLQALSGHPVLTDLWDSGAANAMGTSTCRGTPTRSSSRPLRRISAPKELENVLLQFAQNGVPHTLAS